MDPVARHNANTGDRSGRYPDASSRKRAGDDREDKKRLRSAMTLLFDDTEDNRLLGAKTLGEIARVRPDLIMRRWSRIYNAFDDTMSCWGVCEGLGEIARNIPELRGRIVLRLKKFRCDEVSSKGYVWAMCRVCQVDRERLEGFVPELAEFLKADEADILGQAVWAAGELGITYFYERVKAHSADRRDATVYGNDAVRRTTLSVLTAEALEKLENPHG